MQLTTPPGLPELLPIALDMTGSLRSSDRLRRLVDTVRQALACDAVALLRLDGGDLVPTAAHGLSPDLMGRRFPVAEHPRLDIICESEEPTLFPSDSPLPDPYDGLIEGARDLSLRVHSCLGCPLRVEGQLVGVLTADAVAPGVFDAVDHSFLSHLAALVGAALRTSDLIDVLAQSARHQGMVARDLVRDVMERRGGLMIGTSDAIVKMRREIEMVAKSGFPVLVTGETGVGKELVVRMLHLCSSRAEQPLVYVNCAALPESIAESEMFGHVKGAFTGAESARPGKFRVADGASLFLDEIGELPLHIQPKLLRTLQEGEIHCVGADRPEHVDVRIFAATNRDIDAEVEAGRFRADLLHRLDVCRIHVPPLRERRDDIPQLAGHFADRARRRLGTGPIRFTPDAETALAEGRWPGNVRELDNAVSRAVLRASVRVPAGSPLMIHAEDLGSDVPPATEPDDVSAAPAPRAGRSLRESVEDYERQLIRNAVRTHRGNWSAAARSLGMHRSNLHHLARRLGVR